MPEGQGFVGQRAQAGYMVMISLVTRPILMIAGFFAGMVLMVAMGNLIKWMFIPAMSSTLGGSVIGIASFTAMLSILASVIIQVAHRSFALTYEIPDRILRYIGGSQEMLGESQSQEASNRYVMGAINSGSGKVTGGYSPHLQGSRDQQREQMEEAKGKKLLGDDENKGGDSKANKDLSTGGSSPNPSPYKRNIQKKR